MTEQRKGHPTLRIHNDESIRHARKLLDQAMNYYFQGYPLNCSHRRFPTPNTKEWEHLVAYAAKAEAEAIPVNNTRGVIAVNDFKFVAEKDGMYIVTDASCFSCSIPYPTEKRSCVCLHLRSVPRRLRISETDPSSHLQHKKLSCLAPAFVPGYITECHEPKEVDWTWQSEKTPVPHTNTDHYAHIRETADASYQPTVGELALPHCTFCKNSGEPYAVYRGHTVRGVTGEVECMKLLNIECRGCHERGHTISHCAAAPSPLPAPETEDFYCQFCFKSHEDEAVYRSHNLRNPDGTTNCQKLLTTFCRNCGKLGHTRGYCDQERKRKRGFRRSGAPSPASLPDIQSHTEFPSLPPLHYGC